MLVVTQAMVLLAFLTDDLTWSYESILRVKSIHRNICLVLELGL